MKMLREKIEKIALDLVKLENERFSIPALKLLITCMYIGKFYYVLWWVCLNVRISCWVSLSSHCCCELWLYTSVYTYAWIRMNVSNMCNNIRYVCICGKIYILCLSRESITIGSTFMAQDIACRTHYYTRNDHYNQLCKCFWERAYRLLCFSEQPQNFQHQWRYIILFR